MMCRNVFSSGQRALWFGLALLGGLALSAVSAKASSTITRVSSWTYAANGLILTETTQSGSTSTSACISSPLTASTSGDNTCSVTTNYAYDAYGNKISATVTGTSLPATVNGLNASISYNRTTTTTYDSQGEFVISTTNGLVTNGQQQSESWTYNASFGEPTSHTGPNGLTTWWYYNSLGQKTGQFDSSIGDYTGWTYTYGQFGNSLAAYMVGTSYAFLQNSVWTQSAPATSDIYDTLGRKIESETQICTNGSACTSSNVSTTYVYTVYNAFGQVYQKSPPEATSGVWTTYQYDPLGRVTSIQSPYETNSGTTGYGTTSYSYNGLVQTVTDSDGNATTATANIMGLPYQVTNAANATVTNTYDALGDLLTATDPKGNVTSYTYDVEGRKIKMVDPDRGTWNYAYDALGELVSQIDHDGNQTNFTYDVLGRMVNRGQLTATGAISQTDIWDYDALPTGACTGCIGKLTSKLSTDGNGASISSSTYSYDSFGRPVGTVIATNIPQTSGTATETATGSFTTTYSASTGLVNTVTYASGYQVQYSYTGIGTVASLAGTAVGGTSQTLWTLNASDAAGRTTQETLGNGVVVDSGYDTNTGRLSYTWAGLSSATQTGDPSATNIAAFGYVYDSLGNLTERVDFDADTPNTTTAPTLLSEAFTYDNLYRLSTDTVYVGSTTEPAIDTTYDVLGNITSKSDTSNPAGYSYGTGTSGGGPHAVSSITCTVTSCATNGYNVNTTYSYDANGNALTGDGYTTTWTAYNMAASVAGDTDVYAYTYDADHNRATQQQTKAGALQGTTVYFNDPASGLRSELITWSNGSHGGQWTDYFSVGGEVIGIHVVPTGTTAPYKSFFVHDHLGSVAVVTGDIGCSGLTLGATGSCLLERDSYNAWGRHRNASNWVVNKNGELGSSQSKLGYTGHEEVQDKGTGFQLVNAGARFYDPTTGRFVSPDPMLPEGGGLADDMNPYSYVGNNPLSLTDPTGMCKGLGCIVDAVFPLQLFKDVPILGQINTIAVAAACTYFSGGNGFAGAGCASVATSIQTVYDTGNWSLAAKEGAITGAEDAAFVGVGDLTDGGVADGSVASYAEQIAGDGLVGGLANIAQGQSFESGFLAAGFAAALGPVHIPVNGLGPEGDIAASYAANAALQATEGGFGSVIGGGKFENGAVTGAFGYLFNRLAQSQAQHSQGVAEVSQDLHSQGFDILGAEVRAEIPGFPVRFWDLLVEEPDGGPLVGVEVKTSMWNIFGLNLAQVRFDAAAVQVGAVTRFGEVNNVDYVGVGFSGQSSAYVSGRLIQILDANNILFSAKFH